MKYPKTIVNTDYYYNNKHGYTLLSALISITVLIFILPFTAPLLKSVDSFTNIYDLNHLEVQQFDFFVSFELNRSLTISLDENQLTFERSDGRLITFDQYKNQIRRQTNQQGHTIIMFNVHDFAIKQLNSRTFQISFTREGKLIEQTFNHYNISSS